MLLGDDIVHEIFRGKRRDQPRRPADEHQAEAEGEALPMGPDERPRFFPSARRDFLFLRSSRRGGAWVYGSRNTFGVWRHREIIPPLPSLNFEGSALKSQLSRLKSQTFENFQGR